MKDTTITSIEREELNSVLEKAQQQSRSGWRPAKGKDPLATCVDRRAFLRGGAALAGSMALVASLPSKVMGKPAIGAPPSGFSYGSLSPVADQATGLPLIQLPPGFKYWTFGWQGDLLDDGVTRTPAMHDGMGIIREFGRWLLLVRNHEVAAAGGFTSAGVPIAPQPFTAYPYSTGAAGGTTNLVFDLKTERFVSAYQTLSGTVRNCAGGITPWGTWITCEETTIATAGTPHGYCYDVGALGGSPEPLKRLGRFAHEAVVVDPRTSIVYETEDGPSWPGDTASGFYRFVPRFPGSLNAGGDLQMLKIVGLSQFDLQTLGDTNRTFQVEWVDVPEPDPAVTAANVLVVPESSPFQQGLANGGAKFRRLEGCWYGDEKIFFLSTNGGPAGEGQIFVYNPKKETLRLIYASPGYETLENPDNLTVAPDGSLLLCEDNADTTPAVPNPGERLLFLRDGNISPFAINNVNFTPGGLGTYVRPGNPIEFNGDSRQNEWAGATFSPDGEWLFANIQTPGITFAITGPWSWRRRYRDWERDQDQWDWENRPWNDRKGKK